MTDPDEDEPTPKRDALIDLMLAIGLCALVSALVISLMVGALWHPGWAK